MESERRAVNALQKEIGTIKKAKGDATELLAKKAEHDKKIVELTASAAALAKQRDAKAARIGNIVDPTCHVSLTEVSSAVTSGWVALAVPNGR
jgi:seryl-tRNA synthetase